MQLRAQTRLTARRAGTEATGAAAAAPAAYSAMDVDGETDSNHDTALTLACAGGHEELVEVTIPTSCCLRLHSLH